MEGQTSCSYENDDFMSHLSFLLERAFTSHLLPWGEMSFLQHSVFSYSKMTVSFNSKTELTSEGKIQ